MEIRCKRFLFWKNDAKKKFKIVANATLLFYLGLNFQKCNTLHFVTLWYSHLRHPTDLISLFVFCNDIVILILLTIRSMSSVRWLKITYFRSLIQFHLTLCFSWMSINVILWYLYRRKSSRFFLYYVLKIIHILEPPTNMPDIVQ